VRRRSDGASQGRPGNRPLLRRIPIPVRTSRLISGRSGCSSSVALMPLAEITGSSDGHADHWRPSVPAGQQPPVTAIAAPAFRAPAATRGANVRGSRPGRSDRDPTPPAARRRNGRRRPPGSCRRSRGGPALERPERGHLRQRRPTGRRIPQGSRLRPQSPRRPFHRIKGVLGEPHYRVWQGRPGEAVEVGGPRC
jgi:hypothetical protein